MSAEVRRAMRHSGMTPLLAAERSGWGVTRIGDQRDILIGNILGNIWTRVEVAGIFEEKLAAWQGRPQTRVWIVVKPIEDPTGLLRGSLEGLYAHEGGREMRIQKFLGVDDHFQVPLDLTVRAWDGNYGIWNKDRKEASE